MSAADDVNGKVYDVKEVMRLLAEGQQDITICNGKHVILLCGKLQTGKSTTINALKHGPLIEGEDEKGFPTFSIPDQEKIPLDDIAGIGNGISGCTKGPKGYLFPFGKDMVIVDTRGFFDNRDVNEEAACALLMTNVLERARSVRLVFMISCDQFMQGEIGMRDCGQVIGEILNGYKAPALFLFNYYRAKTKAEFKSMPDDPTELQKYVFDKMKVLWKAVMRDNKKQTDLLYAKTAAKILSSWKNGSAQDLDKRIREDTEFKQKMQDSHYLNMLETAFGSGGSSEGPDCDSVKCEIAYIDPTNIDSIENLRKILVGLPEVPKERMSFKRTSDSAKKFEKNFSEVVPKFLSLQKAINKIQIYSPAVVSSLNGKLLEKVREYEEVLKAIAQGCDEATIAKYEKLYGENKFGEEAEKLKKRLEKYTKEKEKYLKDIEDIKEGPPIEYHHESYSEYSYHPTYRARYVNESVPFEACVSLDAGRVEEVVAEKEHHFEVVYAAGDENTEKKVRAGTIVTEFGVAIIGGVASGFGKPELVPLVDAAGKALTKGISECGKAKLSVRVRYMVKSKDHPEHKQTMLKRERDVDYDETVINELQEELQLLIQSKSSSVGEVVKQLMKGREKGLETLANFERFRDYVLRVATEKKNDMDILYKAAEVLYGKNKRKDGPLTNAIEFMLLYEGHGQEEQKPIVEIVEDDNVDALDVKVWLDELQQVFPSEI